MSTGKFLHIHAVWWGNGHSLSNGGVILAATGGDVTSEKRGLTKSNDRAEIH